MSTNNKKNKSKSLEETEIYNGTIIKQLVPAIVVIFIMLVLVITAAYAYFTVTTSGSTAETTNTTTAPEVGIVSFVSKNKVMNLSVSNEDMKKEEQDKVFYATADGSPVIDPVTPYEEEIGEIKVTGPGTFTCNYSLSITATPEEENLYTVFHTLEDNMTEGQLVLTVNGTDPVYAVNYDFYQEDLFPKTYSAVASDVTADSSKTIKASLKLVNKYDKDQSLLADNRISIGIVLNDIECTQTD